MISNLSFRPEPCTGRSRHRSLPPRGEILAPPTTATQAGRPISEEMMKQTWTAGALRCAVVALALLPWMSPRPASAQAVSGTILGTVRDSSGAAMPGATITLVNTETGLSRTVVTDPSGEFTAPLLPTGTYSVTAEMSGFKKVSLANLHLGVDQKLRADLKLEIGQMSEAIEIQAEAPLVQTNSSELGTTVVRAQIEALPLNGRNFVSLTRTIPGVLRPVPGANIDGAGSLAWRAGSGFNANGNRARDRKSTRLNSSHGSISYAVFCLKKKKKKYAHEQK